MEMRQKVRRMASLRSAKWLCSARTVMLIVLECSRLHRPGSSTEPHEERRNRGCLRFFPACTGPGSDSLEGEPITETNLARPSVAGNLVDCPLVSRRKSWTYATVVRFHSRTVLDAWKDLPRNVTDLHAAGAGHSWYACGTPARLVCNKRATTSMWT